MRFPSWVPKPVSAYVEALLGDSREPGLSEALESAKAMGDQTTVAILEADISCLTRLVGLDDDRMSDAYQLLASEFSEDYEWCGFAAAAWAARMDHGQTRRRLDRAQELAVAIAKKADELAALLDEAGHVHPAQPDEMYSVRALLEATDGHDLTWPFLREKLLGGVDGKTGNTTRYFWSTAPAVKECLMTLAEAARRFRPTEFGMIGAAVGRQVNAKTEYIRAFGAVLKERNIPISMTVMKAIAIAANVALNDAAVDTTAKDVKQALLRSGITRARRKGSS